VDYVAHFNAVMSKDVTPENNAAVLLWQAYGPSAIDEEYRDEYFKQLGVDPLPEKGDYFRELESVAKEGELDAVQRELRAAMARPWIKEAFPGVFRWLQVNQRPLATAVRATQRPQIYHPLVGGPPFAAVLLPHWDAPSREVARALVARAMLRAGEADISAARADLMAVHRLAQLYDRGPCLIEGPMACDLEETALQAEVSLAHSGVLSPKQAREFQLQIESLPPMTLAKTRLDADRFMILDAITSIARDANWREKWPQEDMPPVVDRLTPLVDLNQALDRSNYWYDRMIRAMEQPTYRLRKAEFEAIDSDLKAFSQSVTYGKRLLAALLIWHPAQWQLLRETPADLLALLMLPNPSHCHGVELRHRQRRELTATAFALAAYRNDQQKYPSTLAKLVPKYMKELPRDGFSGDPLIYQTDGDDYVLYSVGPNLEDDAGFASGDDHAPADADDVAMRTRKDYRKR
jgi:hypothetical protein